MTTRIKLRRDTAANWTSNNPVLALGEAGYDTTNNQLRVGDGTTAWSGLEAIGGTGNKITAQKTYSENHSDGGAQTFTYTTGSIAVQMGNNDGLYLIDLLSRWVEYFDGNLTFPYNYSDISLVINPSTTNLSTTVTNVISNGGNPRSYVITLGTTNPGPIVVNDIDFNYNYINTIGLDIQGGEGDYFGMATGDDDITIRSGRDIDLIAADDINIEAGSTFDLTYRNLDDQNPSDGIDIRTLTTSTDYTWTFRFDGSLELPEGLALPTQTNKGYDLSTNLTGPTLRLSNDSQNQVIVTGPAATENNSYAQRIVIQGQRGYGSTSTQGEGGDIYIWGGIGGETNDNSNGWNPGGGSGGDVKLRGGEGLNDTGGYVRIEGGNVAHFSTSTTGDAGFVEITGGDVEEDNDAVSSRGGDVRITGGRAYSATTQSGVVQVITGGTTNPDVLGANTWEFSNDGSLSLPAGGNIRDATSNISVLKTRIGDTWATSSDIHQLTIANDEGKLITVGGTGVGVFRLPQMTADMLGAEFEFYFAIDAGQIHIQSYYTGVRETTDVFRGSIYVGVDNDTTGKLHIATATTSTACDLFLGQHHAKVGSYVKVKAIEFDGVGVWMFQGMCVGDTGQTPNSSDHPFQDYN